jgi:transcriptional regulator with XRE-family HTH domain
LKISNTSINIEKTGKKLKNLASCYGYSVKDIQEYLGLACPQPIYRWYKGIILPSIDNLLRLSELYHLHMEELLVKNYYNTIFAYDCITNDEKSRDKRLIMYLNRIAA